MYRLVGDKRPDHAEYGLAPCLLDGKLPATEALVPFRSEPDNRWLRKQGGGQCLLRQYPEAQGKRS